MTPKKKAVLISTIFLICIIGTFYSILNWGYLPFQNYDYGTSFNQKRLSLGQPIIEDYFYDKTPDWDVRKVWLTPDSIKGRHIHFSKLYWTKKGKITLEKDFYDPIDETPIDTVLIRSYYYLNDSVSYQLTASRDRTTVFSDTLSIDQFDSVKNAWTKKLINNR